MDEEEEDDVVLFWNKGKTKQHKSIRELSIGASDKTKEDLDVLNYYRFLTPAYYMGCIKFHGKVKSVVNKGFFTSEI